LGEDIHTEGYLTNIGLTERQIKAVFYVRDKGKIHLSSKEEAGNGWFTRV